MATAYEIAHNMLGKGEVPDRAAVQEYLSNGGVNLDPVTTAWCAAFVNSSLKQSGVEGTGSNLAKSFLNYGQAVSEPQKGDIAVFSRGDPNGKFGHVGFFEGLGPNGDIRVLGGNQGNAVSESSFPSARLLGYRRPGTVMPDGPKGQEVAPPPLTQGKPVLDHPVANPMQSIDVAGQGAPAAESGLSRIFAALAPAAGAMQPTAPQGGPTQSFGSGDPMGATIAAAQAAQKARGLSSGLMPDIAGLMGLGKRPGAALG